MSLIFLKFSSVFENQEARRCLKKFSAKNPKERIVPMDGELIVG
jgi:hypothetical protein